MPDRKDVTTVIASALSEVNLHGTLDVQMDEGECKIRVGEPRGDDVAVTVTVERADHLKPEEEVAPAQSVRPPASRHRH